MSALARHMESVARHLLGEPNRTLSTRSELRYGSRGSLSIDLTAGTWFDHEAGEGGGVLALVARETGQANGEAVEWLRSELGAEIPDGRARQIVETYDYVDEHGEVLFQVVRLEPKDFRQRRPDGAGGWDWKLGDTRRVPYRLPQILEAGDRTIYVVEGEKDVHALERLGLVATTNPGGAGKWSGDYAPCFQGADVAIIPDNDRAGREHARQVKASLRPVAARVRVVNLPGLPPKGDVRDWIAAGGTVDALARIVDGAGDAEPDEPRRPPLTIDEWLARDLPEPDFIMGQWLTTTSRALMVAPTGLGKTNFALALAAAVAAGRDFMYWRAERPARVIYVDGEMSRRLLKQRAADAVRRLGTKPAGLNLVSHEDHEDFAPLNTPEGQAVIEAEIERAGGADLIVFDNIMSLIAGDQKDEEGWSATLPWIRDLTRRSIAQIWVHHTGHDESRSYGTKTREWQLDTVLHLESVKRDDTDVSFQLAFRKARERTPDTRDDFRETRIALVDDAWTWTKPEVTGKKVRTSPAAQKFREALVDALATDAARTVEGRISVTMDAWRGECERRGLIDPEARKDTARALFSKYRRELIAANQVACSGDLAWLRD